jgi:hypothetical protein
MTELDAYRESKVYRFVKEFYFDITSFYGRWVFSLKGFRIQSNYDLILRQFFS